MEDPELIDTDKLNFLVWRYLLESNYREAAAKFQKEWNHPKPHREFAFAPHVESRALVSVVKRGLTYEALERTAKRRLKTPEEARTDKTMSNGVFGPLDLQAPAKTEGDDVALPDDIELSRKRAQQHQPQLPNGSPAKRPRLSNGFENGTDHTAPDTTPMELDQPSHNDDQQSHDNQAYPSPMEGEQGPSPMIKTDGPEQGTQVDKVMELSPYTTFIRLVDDHARNTAPPSPSPTGAESAPILLQCEWSPTDPSMLAAAGTDALARVWTVSRATVTDPGQDHVSQPSRGLIDPDTPRSTTVTALSWTSDGAAIAVATDCSTHATINVWSADGTLLEGMDVPEPPIVRLCWNPTGTSLIAISPDKGGALVSVHVSDDRKYASYSLPNHDIGSTPLDAAWTSENEFLLCGGDTLVSLRLVESAITLVKKIETREDDSFTQVLFDWRSKLAATASDKGSLDLWDVSGQRRSIMAHQGAITTMAWQALPPGQALPDDERLIATGGDDCAILVWNARIPESKPKCFLTMDSPIVRLAFTPDGDFIAGATASQILIWKVGNTTMPRASWNRPTHSGWLSPRANSEADEEDEHCLCWDASGRKLAYGSNSRLAVINFSR